MKYDKRYTFRADKDTIEQIETLQEIDDCTLSKLFRDAIEFYYDYVQGMRCLFAKHDEKED